MRLLYFLSIKMDNFHGINGHSNQILNSCPINNLKYNQLIGILLNGISVTPQTDKQTNTQPASQPASRPELHSTNCNKANKIECLHIFIVEGDRR